VLGLAGPGKKIAGVMPCTVIAEGDLADRMLNADVHPEWGGLRTGFVVSFPDRMDLWNEYGEHRGESLRQFQDNRLGNKYYKANRTAMDAGAVVSWDSRFDDDEFSAIQHGLNKKLANESAFWAEMQNDPREAIDADVRLMTAKEISGKTNGGEKLAAFAGTETITGFIDVQQKCLFYCLVAWRSDFTGAVLDYGTFPDQNRRYFNLSDVNQTLQKRFPGTGLEGSITAGLGELVGLLCGRPYMREDDNAELSPSLILVDTNWQTATVRDFCRRLRSTTIVPAHGRYVGASSRPIAEYKKSRGEKTGLHWKSSTIERLRHVLFDTNFWKSHIHERLGVAFGDKGSLTMWGNEALSHRMIGEQLVAEYRVRVTNNATGRTVDEWKQRAGNPDNHLFDCCVGSAVAASIMGATLPTDDDVPVARVKRRRRRINYG
jgi:hypothetical protein